MTDLTELLKKVQVPDTSHTDLIKRTGKGTLQWFLENESKAKTHPIFHRNHLEFFVCGEAGFASIDRDIRAASCSIDLVCWGFDPGMELVRGPLVDGKAGRAQDRWPRGMTYGDLLTMKAREGVKVRLLVWFNDELVNLGAQNLPDKPVVWMDFSHGTSALHAPTRQWLEDHAIARSGLEQIRADYCRAWWIAALGGRFPNLEVRMRAGSPADIRANVARHLPDKHSLIETAGLYMAATHHQKPILIDYDAMPGKKANTCAYVMGLNSVTDYWDSHQHLYNDARRETHWKAGASWTNAWHLKPYRDYAIRVQGEALYKINENFVEGWDTAGPAPVWREKLQPKRSSIRPESLPAPVGARHSAQILRTQPEKLDATILKGYVLATSNALNYIYVENQYFQLADWPRLIRKVRSQYLDGIKKAGGRAADVDPLHLFVVIPQPERDQMVPRTYDTVGGLGAGDGMGEYHKQVQGKRKSREEQRSFPATGPGAKVSPADIAAYEKRLRQRQVEVHGPGDESITGESTKEVPHDVKDQLDALGIKPLVAMLMTYDARKEAKDIRIRSRDNAAQEAQARQEAQDGADGRASDVEAGNYADANIVPRPYREIYIHSKLMLVDDVYTTLGSANLNARSMVVDSEFNICTDEHDFTQNVRRQVWGNLAGEDLNGGDGSRKTIATAHGKWRKRIENNRDGRKPSHPPENGSFIHPFEDPRSAPGFRLE